MVAAAKEFLSKRKQILSWLIPVSLALGFFAIYWVAKPLRPVRPLRVGVRHSPPYYFAEANRSPSGLGVDVINEAARRLNFPITWIVIQTGESSETALQQGKIDIWPALTVTPERKTDLYLTEPWLQSNYFLLSLHEKGIESLADLKGKPVSFIQSSFQIRLSAKYLPHARLIRVNTAEEALQAVCGGQADAAFLEARAGQALLLKRPAGCESSAIRFAAVEGATLLVAVASPKAFEREAGELRAEIGRMAQDGTLDSIVARWSFITIKETLGIYTLQESRQRTRWSIYGIVILLVALQVCLWQIYRARIARRVAEEASKALRSSEERYRSLVENANDIVYTHDLDGIMTSLNRAGEILIGYSRHEMLGKNIIGILAPEHEESFREALRRGKAGEMHFPLELEIIGRDGRRLTMEINARLIRQGNEPVSVQGIARNVTDRRHLEDQLRQAQKMEAVGKLAGGVAHDFNNLLTVIIGYTELLQSRLAADDQENRMIHEIRKAAEQAASLTAQLLAFGRRQRLLPRVLDLNAVVSATQKMLVRIIGEQINLVTQLDPGIGPVKADPSQIQQVIMNLSVNARDAMPRGGALNISTTHQRFKRGHSHNGVAITPGDYVVLSVSDTGHGMDKQTQERIFEPFFTTKEMGKGTGLGLSTVYGIVKQSGGYVWVNSEPDKGTIFSIYLPQTDEPLPVQKAEIGVATAPGSGTVLLVEDEETVRDMARTCLELSGYSVIEAADGVEALRIVKLQKVSIDLLLTDVVMPFMTGPELAEQVTAICPKIKVLFMSGYSDRDLGEGTIAPSFANFLQKPFTPRALSAKLSELIQRNSD